MNTHSGDARFCVSTFTGSDGMHGQASWWGHMMKKTRKKADSTESAFILYTDAQRHR